MIRPRQQAGCGRGEDGVAFFATLQFPDAGGSCLCSSGRTPAEYQSVHGKPAYVAWSGRHQWWLESVAAQEAALFCTQTPAAHKTCKAWWLLREHLIAFPFVTRREGRFCESSTETGDDSFNLWETMEEEDQPERHFIGFDFSTQQVIKI